jgi:hypothetical protein
MPSEDVDSLIADEHRFRDFIYTPLEEAVGELRRRWEDKELEQRVHSLIEVPEVFQKEPTVSLFRHVCTPNFDTHRFVSIADALDLKPLFVTYESDKFVSGNPQKLDTARMRFYQSREDDSKMHTASLKIVDIPSYDGKRLAEVETLWGQKKVEFHRELFLERYGHIERAQIYDISTWYQANGGSPAHYYEKVLCLFVRNTILFENFLLSDKWEHSFIKDIFLPAFVRVTEETGRKPLIVSLEPTELEDKSFWTCYPESLRAVVYNKIHD